MSEKSVKYRILLLTNCDSDNVGDQVIEATDKSLLHTVFKNLGVGPEDYTIVSQPAAIVPKSYLNTKNDKYIAEAVEEISAADLVIVGGAPMFNYKYQLFYERTALIIELCEKLSTPIVFSAIGIEHYDGKDKKCKRIKNALNRDIVKMVTTRDRIDLLEKYVTNEDIITGMVMDPAVFSASAFRSILAKKRESRKKIGIFVLRAGGFVDNKFNFTRDESVAMWVEIARRMKAKGYDCEFLTSGHFADEAILDYMVRNKLADKNDCVFGMNTPEKLIGKISSYDGVISCRLHPSIISYALDVPSVGVVWNEKVPGFYNSIGYSERALSTVGISADKVIEALDKAMNEGVKKNEEQLMAIYNALYNIVKKTLRIPSEADAFDYEALIRQMPDCDHTTSAEFDKKLTKKFRRALLAYNNSKKKIDELNASLVEANRHIEQLETERQEVITTNDELVREMADGQIDDMSSAKKVLVLSRKNITNYGDPIIGDCCRYLVSKAAKKANVPCLTKTIDVYTKDDEEMQKLLANADAVIVPGGGINSVVFNKRLIKVMDLAADVSNAKFFFNAVGILNANVNPKNEALMVKMLNREEVSQVTTRGDYDYLQKYLKKDFEFPSEWVLDPAVWCSDAYRVKKDADSKVIGIGVIRPEIFEENHVDMSAEDTLNMYLSIIKELESRGHKWQLFYNGMKEDRAFCKVILQTLGRDKEKGLICPKINSSIKLIRQISTYQGVIAARLHANIISTSLGIPSIGLVWNNKMFLFADIIGSRENYIVSEKLKDGAFIVEQMEKALRNGYNMKKINAEKIKTMNTYDNIIKAISDN